MKYFIAGREIHSDKNLQTGALQNYYELGWEVVTTHLLVKRFINNKKLDPYNDIVVTCEGREFFYDNYIKTIKWSDYQEIVKNEITETYESIDFFLYNILNETKFFHELYFKDMNPKYKFFEQDFEMITNLNFNKSIIPSTNYICFNRRFRKHREELNMSEEYTINLLNKLNNIYNVPIYMTGFHNEKFKDICNINIVNLKDWCSLLNNDKCLFVIQNQTGTANLTQLCAKTGLLNVILDMEGAHYMSIYKNGRRPDVLGKAVNFKNTKNLIFFKEANIDEVLSGVNKYVKS